MEIEEQGGGGLVQAGLIGCSMILVLVLVGAIVISIVGYSMVSSAVDETHSGQIEIPTAEPGH
jgi:hypothetical protein